MTLFKVLFVLLIIICKQLSEVSLPLSWKSLGWESQVPGVT